MKTRMLWVIVVVMMVVMVVMIVVVVVPVLVLLLPLLMLLPLPLMPSLSLWLVLLLPLLVLLPVLWGRMPRAYWGPIGGLQHDLLHIGGHRHDHRGWSHLERRRGTPALTSFPAPLP